MEAGTYEIDPDGDLLMRFSCWHAWPLPSTAGDDLLNNNEDGQLALVDDSEDEIANDIGEDPLEAPSIPEPSTNETPKYTNPKDDTAADDIYFRVSSKHMMLASPVFKSMFARQRFSEGQTLEAEGSVTVPFPDDDPDSFIIILEIIHGANRKVPRKLSLRMLKEVAILVRKYQMLEVVELFTDIWINKLVENTPLPTTYSRETSDWLFIFWVFENAPKFKKMSQVLQLECTEDLEMDFEGLQISELVIDSIKTSRETAIESAISVIDNLIDKYSNEEPCKCPDNNRKFVCGSASLGSLIKSSKKLGILRPRLLPPYSGKSVKDQLGAIRVLEIAVRGVQYSNYGYNQDYDYGCRQHLQNLIETSIESIEAGLCGLDLWDFKKHE